MNTEQNIIDQLLTQLAGLLGPLSPFTKAIVPAGLAVAVAAVNCVFAGKIDAFSLTVAGSGLALAVVTYLVPNLTKPAAAKPAAPAKPSTPPGK